MVRAIWTQVGNKSETTSKCIFARQGNAAGDRAPDEHGMETGWKQGRNNVEVQIGAAGRCTVRQGHMEGKMETGWKHVRNNVEVQLRVAGPCSLRQGHGDGTGRKKAGTMSKWRFAWQPHAIDDRATVTVAWKQVGNKSETMSKCSFAWQDYAVCNRATVRASRKQVGNKSEAMSKYTFFVAGLCNSPQCHGEVTTETCRKQIGNNLQDADLHGRAMQFATGPR